MWVYGVCGFHVIVQPAMGEDLGGRYGVCGFHVIVEPAMGEDLGVGVWGVWVSCYRGASDG